MEKQVIYLDTDDVADLQVLVMREGNVNHFTMGSHVSCRHDNSKHFLKSFQPRDLMKPRK